MMEDDFAIYVLFLVIFLFFLLSLCLLLVPFFCTAYNLGRKLTWVPSKVLSKCLRKATMVLLMRVILA
jgi:hypothetical protein